MTQRDFKLTDDIYRGTDFWMLNGELTDGEIKFQLGEMKEKGVYSFIARTYLGLKSDYPGPDFMSKMRTIVDTSRELGLKVFLQAGYMPEAVLGLPESCALRYIMPVNEGEEGGRRVLCRHGETVFVEHNSVTFLDMFDPDAMDFYLKVCYEDMWAEFAEEYGKTILSVWVDEPSYNGSYLPWTPKAEAMFEEKFGYSLAENVWLLFFDGEGYERVRYDYRTLMRDLLEENYFKKVRDWCHAHNLLFSGHLMMEDTLQSQIRRAQACMPYYRYFDIPGIDVLAGEMGWVDDPIQGTSFSGDRKYNLYTTALQCTSAARQSGKEHILAEMYGVAGENFTFRNMTNMFDCYAALGINHRSVHGMFYTLHGRGKRAYPPHISYYQPFWKKYKNITDYVARVSAFISDGAPARDVAVIHPLETAYLQYRGQIGDKAPDATEINRQNACLYELLEALCSEQREVDLADLASIRDLGAAENGSLRVGRATYGTVVLPKLRVITSECLEMLERMTAEGGKVVCWGDAPALLDGRPAPDAARRIEAISTRVDSVSDLMSTLPAPTCKIDGVGAANILLNHRICDGGEEKFFIYNRDCAHEARVTLTAKTTAQRLFKYDAYSGEIYSYPCKTENGLLTAEARVPVGGSVLLSAENSDAATAGAIEIPALTASLSLNGKWTAIPQDKNVLLLEYCRFRCGNEEFSREIPTLAVQRLLTVEEYRGPITLQYEFNAKTAICDLSLAVEGPGEQEIYLDGIKIEAKPDGYFCDKSFETLRLGNVSAGRHRIEIRRDFAPLSKVTNFLTQLFETRRGVELEPLYLLGDFAVRGHRIPSFNGCSIFERQFELESLNLPVQSYGELTAEGFPFYVGEMTLSRRVNVPEGIDPEGAVLSLGVMNAGCGELFVNGTHAGDINRAPAEIPVGKHLKSGENLIEIRLYSTIYNIIGPFHRPRGNVGNTFGGGYKNPDAAWLSVDTSRPNWNENMEDFYPTWTHRYNVVPFGVKDVALIFGRGKI